MNFIRKYLWLIIIGFILLPIGLNYILNVNIGANVIGMPKDWLNFWGTYISGFASFVMLFIAWKTLMETKSANRPYISIQLLRSNGKLYLECRNIGKSIATDVNITFPKNFIDKVPSDIIKKNIQSISKQKFAVGSTVSKNILLLYGELSLVTLKIYGGDVKTKNIIFNSEQLNMEDANDTYNYFVENFNQIEVSYSNEYKYNIPINILDYKEEEQNLFRVIAFRLEAIENEFKAFNNKK